MGRISIAAGTCAALLGSTLAFANGESTKQPTSGQATVEKTCAGCHPGPQLDAVVAAHVADQEPRLALDAFLAKHHVPDPELRGEVIAYLVSRLDAR